MILNSLYDAINDTTNNKPAVKKESIRLLAFLAATHTDYAATHLPKIIGNILKRLKDSDSGVKDACREAIGQLSFLYLKGENGGGDDNNIGPVVSLFVKPLFEAMNEQNKGVQAGAAMCMAKMVEMASDHPPLLAFQKLNGRIWKFLNSPNFLANAALLPVVSSLSQVGAISRQVLEPLLQSIHECLNSSDWTTRKAAADTLNVLALYSSNLITEKPTSTITILEACRFDKIKPVRDSITEALQVWKHISEGCEDQKPPDQPAKLSGKGFPKSDGKRTEPPPPPSDGQTNGQSVSEKTIGTKKKAPPLSDKELNPEFFQRLERRVSGEVEVVVNRRFVKSSNSQNEEEPDINDTDPGSKSKSKSKVNLRDCNPESRAGDSSSRQQECDDKNDRSHREGLTSSNGNWLGIQRQLIQLERQQAYLMNMLQDFRGGSRDGMVTLENRVRGLERVVEDMACNLSVSSNSRRVSSYMTGFDESCGRSLGKYNGFSDYPNTKYGRNDDGISYRASWRPDNGRNTHIGLRKTMDSRSPKSENGSEHVNRRGWGDVRFGEGPSARSIWQASKDEATLAAIRVAGDGDGPVGNGGAAAEVAGDESRVRNREPVWRNAMDAVRLGDMDTAFAEVLSSGDDLLLVKLMDRTGPVVFQLSSDVASEVLHAVVQFLLEPYLIDICLSWIQQLLNGIVENGTDVLGIPMEVKREILVNLDEASSTIDLPEDWEGLMPDQLLLQLASVWNIVDLQHLHKS